MDMNQVIQGAITSAIANLGTSAGTFGAEKIRNWMQRAKNRSVESIGAGLVDIEGIADKIVSQRNSNVGQHQYTTDTLSRWLEVPEPDLATLSINDELIDVLIQHIMLEFHFYKLVRVVGLHSRTWRNSETNRCT